MDEPRTDLVQEAILSRYTGDFDWIDERTALRVSHDPSNQGLVPAEIRKLTQEWVKKGGPVFHKIEDRPDYRHKRDYWYWVIIKDLADFPRGLFVEMELTDQDPENPMVSILNVHPSTFS